MIGRTVGRKKENRFLGGVMLLSLSTVLVKLIGLFYKIPMMSYLGAEGMGYFNSAYEVYALLCVISTSGLPTALSILVASAKESGQESRLLALSRISMRCFFWLGTIGSLALLLFSRVIVRFAENEGAWGSLVAIAPALLFVCVSSAVRGYCQGLSDMKPTAISQLIEAVGKLVFGVWFASAALARGADLRTASAFAALGLTLGCALSFAYLLWERHRRRIGAISLQEAGRGTLGALLRIAFPVTLSASLLSLVRLVDMVLILRRLQDIGYSASAANAVYGSYATLALPLFGLVPSLVTPIALALVPKISASVAARDEKALGEVANLSQRLTVLFAMPASAGLSVYARPILHTLFAGEGEAVEQTAPLLSLLGISVLFSCLITTTSAILQAMGHTALPIVSMAVGGGIKILAAYMLLGNPDVGVYGAPISTFLCNLTITGIHLVALWRLLPRRDGVSRLFLRPFLATLLSIGTSFLVYRYWVDRSLWIQGGFFVAAPIAVVVYVLLVPAFGILEKEELASLPVLGRYFARHKTHKSKKTAEDSSGKERMSKDGCQEHD